MRVPPELDTLMWAIAEDDSASAAEEFLRRYPGYRDELMRRQSAVAGLRASKPMTNHPLISDGVRPIPRFTPRKVRYLPPEPRQVAIASILGLAAIAAASFTIASLVSPRPAAVRDVVPPRIIPPPVVQPTVPRTGSQGKLEIPAPAVVNEQVPKDREQERQSDTTRPAPSADRPITLVIKGGARLRNVLRMVEIESGLTIVYGPGLPNPDVNAEYRQVAPIDILKDLGRQYGFTPFDQGDGTVNVFPAVDAHGDGSDSGGVKTPLRRIGG
jgi:hypothetical protein